MAEFEPEYSIRRGRQHYAMNVEDTPHESVTGLHNYLVKKSPFNYMGFDYYLSAVPDNMPDSARIDVFAPMLDTGRNADKLWSGERIRYYEDLGIDDFDYDYEEEIESPYIMQNPVLHDIQYNQKYGEHYDYDERFRDDHPEEMLKYDKRESDFINEPGAAYEWAWRERYSDLKKEMDKLGKLFGIEGILINRYPDRPWMRQADSYGNENIRPGEKVPRKINEQEDRDGEEGRIEDETDFGDGKPFTPLETRILNTLHKYLTRSDLQSLSQETPENYGALNQKFWDVMKIFGITTTNTENNTRVSKYAKWALDNWTEEGDYGNIENPIKVPLKWYDVDREESGSQIEYKSGNAEILGFDEDDASDRADYNFYDWGGEMETDDYGDYETYDSEVTRSDFIRVDEGLARVLREDMSEQKIQDLLFQFWMRKNIGPTLDPDKLKLLGFDMNNEEDKILVYNNLIEYYGDEELANIVHERLEGVHDADYQFIVTSYDSLTPRTYKSEARGLETYIDVLINGDQIIPISQEDGTVIDMTVWEANEKAAQEEQENPYEDAYEGIREEIHYYLDEVILQNLPIQPHLDYVDFSEPGTFQAYAQESLTKQPIEMITEEEEGELEDLVYIDEPREKHVKKMKKGLGKFQGFPIQEFMNIPPPSNESDTTEDEIEHIESIPVDKEFVDTTDDIDQHFKTFLKEKGLEYPNEDLKGTMKGVKNIILQLKYHYNRPRPGQVADKKELKLNPTTLDSASTPSYPSGHATQGRFIGRYLAELYPEYSDELLKLGYEVGHGRLMAKVHYPSDQKFGIELADALYEYSDNPEIELDEFCPMGKPNKCKIVDYGKLPDMIHESAPQPGSSSAEGFDDKNLPYETEYLTLDEILSRVKGIAYYKEVLRDLRDDKEDWEVTQTVKRYADYWMENPESLTGPDFPPIQVIGNGMKDGSHRISTLNALANHIDVDNPYWKDVKLEVRFYDPETVMSSGHYYPWLWDISDEDLQQAIDDKVYNWEVLERWLADPNAKSDLKKLRAESLNEHKESKLNPQLMMGDEILVLDAHNPTGASFNPPKLYTPYVVIGIKHRQPENSESPDVDTRYYELERIDMTDEERLGELIAGGGRRRLTHLYPNDTWMLRKGFLRGELNEGENPIAPPPVDEIQYGETINVKPNVGDKIILIDKEELLTAFESNQPELFAPYVVISKHDYNFQLVKVDEYNYWREWLERGSDEVPSPQKIFYPLDYKWMDASKYRLYGKTISEHNQPELSPELEEGDVIRVIEIDGEHARMPERWGVYKVEDIKQDNATQEFYYDIVPYPEPELPDILSLRDTLSIPNRKTLYHGDTWIYADVDRNTISEHEETGLNPELEEGDTILIIDIDRERESGEFRSWNSKYTSPPEGYRPEMWVPYEVVKKESAGHKSEWPFKYIVVPEGEIWTTGRNPQGEENSNEKLLYPWIYQWIYADTPMATGVDRKTLNEHDQQVINPDLEEGDIIRVIEVKDEGRPNKPERGSVYKVLDKGMPPIVLANESVAPWYTIVPHPAEDLPNTNYMAHLVANYGDPRAHRIYWGDTWIHTNVDRKTISEQKQEFNQPLTMGDVIRVVDVDKEATYEQPTYPYDTGNASGNSLMTNHHRGQIHGQDTYPHPMRLYAVMSKSLYRTKDRDYLNPYWMLWPVDKDGKVESIKDFHEIILTDKDTWMTIKKHHSNIPGDIEAKHKEYVDSGRDIISRVVDEQVMMKKGDMLKSDIITFLTNRFILGSTDYSELKDNKGNYYRIIDMNDPYEHVTLSDLIEPAIEFVSSGIKSGDFEEEDMNTALTAITNWVSLEMNQKKELVN